MSADRVYGAPYEIDQEMVEKLKSFHERGEIGPTGNFPQGKLTAKDEGEYKFMVATIKDKVVINFGRSIAWIAMNRNEALDLARILKKRAKKLTP